MCVHNRIAKLVSIALLASFASASLFGQSQSTVRENSSPAKPLAANTASDASAPSDSSVSQVVAERRFASEAKVYLFETGQLLSAIDERLGARYRYGAQGPRAFDCSGFVWSTFKSIGVEFERGSARTLWHRFEPVERTSGFQFGTLVFFNNLHHVGIVADERGFYHASRRNGVTYQEFNDYWLKRIDGFRRVSIAVAD